MDDKEKEFEELEETLEGNKPEEGEHEVKGHPDPPPTQG